MSTAHEHHECGCSHGKKDSSREEAMASLIDGVFPDESLVIENNASYAAEPQSVEDTVAMIEQMVVIIGERSRAYVDFASALEAYKADQNWTLYNLKTGELTAQFQDLSSKVQEIQKKLSLGGQDEFAEHLLDIQKYERERFTSSVKLQLQNLQFTVLKDDMWNDEYQASVSEHKAIISRSIREIGALMEELEDFVRENK